MIAVRGSNWGGGWRASDGLDLAGRAGSGGAGGGGRRGGRGGREERAAPGREAPAPGRGVPGHGAGAVRGRGLRGGRGAAGGHAGGRGGVGELRGPRPDVRRDRPAPAAAGPGADGRAVLAGRAAGG